MSIGAVVVGLYPTNTASECAYILGHSEAVLAFVEDDAQREKLDSIRDGLPALREIVGFDDLAEFERSAGDATSRSRSARTTSRRSSTRRARPARRRAAC